MTVEIIHGDGMKYLAGLKENEFDLAVVDPPYGIGRFERPSGKTRFNSSKMMQEEGLKWDQKPSEEFFKALFNTCKNQIVFGANNFTMPPSEYFLIWNKKQTVSNFSSAEYAWVSMGLKMPAKVFDYSIHKHNQTVSKIHPTQKPVALYRWIFRTYAKPGMRILDTHLGSGSSAIAAHYEGLDFVGIELDEDYYKAAKKRFEKETRQETLFAKGDL